MLLRLRGFSAISCWRDGAHCVPVVVASTDGQQARPVQHAGPGGEVLTTTSLFCKKWRDIQATEGYKARSAALDREALALCHGSPAPSRLLGWPSVRDGPRRP